uniref:ATP synthase subunit g, mitochondrial-like n=1 Tax=Saccoglossus kowalevskii TaxID=10224 RepID=A0ABM0GT37_SACKO|nr:PREDICTED: ATP synthase subunit g, mitochondrial-like [Saccoglossus kowalevskii]
MSGFVGKMASAGTRAVTVSGPKLALKILQQISVKLGWLMNKSLLSMHIIFFPDLKIPNVANWSKPRLSKFWYYAKVELIPPTPAEFPKISKGISDIVASAKTGKWKQLTVREAWLNTLVAVEVCFWFFIGEQIGRRSLIGYNIDLAVEPPKHNII